MMSHKIVVRGRCKWLLYVGQNRVIRVCLRCIFVIHPAIVESITGLTLYNVEHRVPNTNRGEIESQSTFCIVGDRTPTA